ncbi:MAG: hypothetical protein A3E38_00400 [Candidatus Moranbacteria bacterium RIFCSPHIGHO2_12_FULL_54_9]|nr:MAG: hypothetical protein A2878_02265 [Candidatus Moranbacteria bacterium RIFCSPHIGHO2_01_FULL_54_31]OGI24930.1 MAG: hypothetical protein A3E38_00400 [Candidatus Moranbacteria bacterium RIFCSPHIGHO2_12_FULL_54_9]
MNIDIFGVLYGIGQSAATFFSTSFFIAALKFFLFVYVAVLLADIVMLLMLRGLSGDLKVALFGADRPLLSQFQAINRFEKSLARLESGNPSQYKVAVLEADAFADEVLTGIGYKGATMGAKLDSIPDGQIETKHLLVEAHQIRNRIVHETGFAIAREEAHKCLEAYRAFFDEMELF